MTSIITINLPFPISVNAAYANGGKSRGRHKTPRYLAWRGEAAMNIRDIHRQKIGRYDLVIKLNPPDKRKRDLGNLEKVVSDLLVDHGIIDDDSGCQSLYMKWERGLEAPCVVTVTSVD